MRLTEYDTPAVRGKVSNYEMLRGQEIKPKFKMKTSVKVERTLSSEKSNKPQAIAKLDHPF